MIRSIHTTFNATRYANDGADVRSAEYIGQIEASVQRAREFWHGMVPVTFSIADFPETNEDGETIEYAEGTPGAHGDVTDVDADSWWERTLARQVFGDIIGTVLTEAYTEKTIASLPEQLRAMIDDLRLQGEVDVRVTPTPFGNVILAGVRDRQTGKLIGDPVAIVG